jgi:hypothetical protein
MQTLGAEGMGQYWLEHSFDVKNVTDVAACRGGLLYVAAGCGWMSLPDSKRMFRFVVDRRKKMVVG